MLRADGSLTEIGQTLRHVRPVTTTAMLAESGSERPHEENR